MKKLENKVAVITGATSGMALATAKLFVEEGAFVFITGRRQKELDLAVAAIGKNVIGVKCDSSVLSELDHLFEVVEKEKGQIDILYASAGVAEFGFPIGSMTEEHFDKTFNLNTKGTVFTVQKALRLMKDEGSIIMTGTAAISKVMEGLSTYSASKMALRVFARTWSVELKSRRIRVNVVSPGPIQTGVFEQAPAGMVEAIVSLVPYRRIGQPEEIAAAVLFLASDDSKFVTGVELNVDGGMALV
ncbi:MAG TPA: SDR family oxidoreductase [Puia sp.]|uniref:SDR family NAD(P)-dependent oxidoreductase n=1 Tax=Puia sp. TaxID=2045100 RepID=UPI002C2CF31A|nr:SDR family oxidoreductase [Puia sp.]HVU98736.1 SDR family oxidoreductase [Puia sp.]